VTQKGKPPEKGPAWLCPSTLRWAADDCEALASSEQIEAFKRQDVPPPVPNAGMHHPQNYHFPGAALLRARKRLRRKATVIENQNKRGPSPKEVN